MRTVALALALGAGALWAAPAASAAQTIFTAAGTGVLGFGGDGGPATRAVLNHPRGLAALPDGGYLIADATGNRVRRVYPSGIIRTVAGTGTAGATGDGGRATSARLRNPHSVAVLPDGGFLIADDGNHRIRKVSSSGTITTVAGTGVAAYGGDGGPAVPAPRDGPRGGYN
jgi:glucose/arabinose dehydrogenase